MVRAEPVQTLIYLSPLPWNSFAQRPHKFVEWFHERTGGRVVWLDPYPTRLPVWSDFKRVKAGLTSSPQLANAVPDWLELLQPKALPIEPLPLLRGLNRWIWRTQVQRLKAIARLAPCTLVLGKPSALALELIAALPGVPTVFDCMDDFPAFYAGVSKWAMARTERSLAQRVDEVWASGRALMGKLQPLNPGLKYIPNGLDLSRYSGGVTALGKPQGAPVVWGYVGTIAAWFDWEWVIHLAHCRPQDEVRLIGPVFAALPARLPANVRLLPACTHQQAIEYMAQMTVGLIPFIRNELTSSVDPIKYYEYRAVGLPVVSTAFGDMAGRGTEAGCFISHSLSDVAGLLEQALGFRQSPEDLPVFRRSHSWEARFDLTGLNGPSDPNRNPHGERIAE